MFKKDSGGKPIPYGTGTNTSAIFSDVAQWLSFSDQEVRDLGPCTHLYTDLYPYLREWLDIVGDRVITRILAVGKRVIPFARRKAREESYDPFLTPGFGRPKGLGKLGYKVEPAGKIRVFAMVDSLTQCVMKPLHDLLFSLLRRLETDGTFDQMRPANRLVSLGFTSFWSLDLSSATDRFPLALQQAVLSVLIGPRLGALWARLLVLRYYLTPRAPSGVRGPEADTALLYGSGQPMGALTSWAAFSLTHHFLVQFAAYRATREIRFFKAYALLGDDIVIADHNVALAYQALLLEIGVEYGLAKSLISHTGGFEFAKRTFSKGKDVSAISLAAIGVAKADHTVLEQVLTRFGVNRNLFEALRVSAKVLGYGYRSVARLSTVLKTKTRLQGLAILLSRPGSPWGLEVIQWLLQRQPGIIQDVPQAVLLEIGESLFDSLSSKASSAIDRAREKLEKVIYPDSTYGGNVDVWFDDENLQAEAWNIYIVVPLVAELKIDLKDLKERLQALERPSLDDLNEIWLRIEEIRDAIAALPNPNFFERSSLDFGGAKRSALLKTFRSVRNWLSKSLARNLDQRCLPIIGMAMGLDEGTEVITIETPQTVIPEVDNVMGDDTPRTLTPGAQFTMMGPDQTGIWTELVLTPSGLAPSFTYMVKGVLFKEDDVFLDGIHHREDLPYSLAFQVFTPAIKTAVMNRLRDEQYEDF
jgi:hypothetical protein